MKTVSFLTTFCLLSGSLFAAISAKISECNSIQSWLDNAKDIFVIIDKIDAKFVEKVAKITGTLTKYATAFTAIGPFIVENFLADPRICPIQRKLDTIFDEIRKISVQVDGLGFLIECEFVKHRFDLLRLKLEKLNDVINYKNKLNIRCRCNNVGSGLQDIFTELKYFLREGEISNLYRSCAKYESDKIRMWVYEIVQISKAIITFVPICDSVNSRNTTFNTVEFAREVETIVNQAVTKLAPLFVRDNSNIGLRSTVKYHTTNARSAKELMDTLKEKYSFFDWDAVFVHDNSWRLERWVHWRSHLKREARVGIETNNCGSVFYNEDEVGTNAVVAWSPVELRKTPISSRIESYTGNFFSHFIADRFDKKLEVIANRIYDEDMIFLYITQPRRNFITKQIRIHMEPYSDEYKFMVSKLKLKPWEDEIRVHYLSGANSTICTKSFEATFPILTTQNVGLEKEC